MKLRYLTLCNNLFDGENSPYTDSEIRRFGIRLRHESAYITDYIKRGANEELKFNCVRLNLACTTSPVSDKIRKFESVNAIEIPFDMSYWSMTPIQKEQYLIDVTESGLQRFCNCEKWDFSIFKKYIDLLRANSSSVEFYIPKKTCKKDQLSAKVYCVQNMTESIFFVDFFFKRTLINRKFLTVSDPTAETYRTNIFRLEWSDEKTVSVYDCTDQLYAKVAFDMDLFQAKSNLPSPDLNKYKEQIDRIYRIKSLLCKEIDVDVYDCNIETWEENDNGQVFVTLLLIENAPQRCLAIINSSGVVAYEFCDDYFELSKVAKSLKKKMG